MPIDPNRLCKCHGEPMHTCGGRAWCSVKRKVAQRNSNQKRKEAHRVWRRQSRNKYDKSAKGRARKKRYQASEKYLAAKRRYMMSPKGQAKITNQRARRVMVGSNFYTYAATPELAQQIRDHIRRRLSEFKQSQRAERP